MIKMVETNQI